MMEGRPRLCPDARDLYDGKVPEDSFIRREDVVSAAALPLKVNGEVIGQLFVSYRKRRTFGHDEMKIMEMFAALAAMTIQRESFVEARRGIQLKIV
jgi:GAF domain-containing protein